MKLKAEVKDGKTLLRLERLGLTIDKNSLIGVGRASEYVRGKIVSALNDNKYGIKTDTGTLKRSFYRKAILKSPGVLLGMVGTKTKYARIHEMGGTILRKSKLKYPGKTTKIVVEPKWYMRRSLLDNAKNVVNVIQFWIDKGWKR